MWSHVYEEPERSLGYLHKLWAGIATLSSNYSLYMHPAHRVRTFYGESVSHLAASFVELAESAKEGCARCLCAAETSTVRLVE